MSKMSQVDGLYSVGASVDVTAPIGEVFSLLATPSRHREFDGSGTVQRMIAGPPRLYLNARFRMRMILYLPYAIDNVVVEFEEPYLIAWRHVGRHRWRYRLEAISEETTRVTEVFDWKDARGKFLYEVLGFPTRNSESILSTLENLRKKFSRSS